MERRHLALVCGIGVIGSAACTRSPPPVPKPGTSASPVVVPVATTPDAAAAGPPDKHREQVAECVRGTPHAPDYCECVWSQSRTILTEDEMTADNLSEPKKEQLKSLIAVCASKHREELIAEAFSKACTGNNPALQAFCDCQWVGLRKRFSADEIADPSTVDSEPSRAARKELIKSCGAILPERESRDGFMEACAMEASSPRYCECAWTELRKIASTAEIGGQKFDKPLAAANVARACGPLRP